VFTNQILKIPHGYRADIFCIVSEAVPKNMRSGPKTVRGDTEKQQDRKTHSPGTEERPNRRRKFAQSECGDAMLAIGCIGSSDRRTAASPAYIKVVTSLRHFLNMITI
jgi:hypothetical protein